MRLAAFLSGRLILVASVLLLLTVPAWGTDTPTDRATLKGITEVKVVVETIDPNVERHGLTQSQLRTDVELRLRHSGITVDSTSHYILYVNVNTARTGGGIYAYNIEVSFGQAVMLLRDPQTVLNVVPTWSVGSVGTIRANRLPNVQSRVIDYVDKFIAAYLEQNPKR